MADGKKGGERASKFLRAVNRGGRPTRAAEGRDERRSEVETEQTVDEHSSDTSALSEEVAELESDTQERSTPQQGSTAQRRSSIRKTSSGGGARARKRSRPEKPVRITVNLDSERHRFLRDYAYRQDISGTAVMRALLEELRNAPGLSERVSERLLDIERGGHPTSNGSWCG